MAETVNTNQFKNGMHIELDGDVWRIVEFQHVKPGKGGAFVRTKLKALESGAVVERTFRAGEKFTRIRTETKNMQYLYDSGEEVVFMDEDTYEQTSLPRGTVEDARACMQSSRRVALLAMREVPEPDAVDVDDRSELLPAGGRLAAPVLEKRPGVDDCALVPRRRPQAMRCRHRRNHVGPLVEQDQANGPVRIAPVV